MRISFEDVRCPRCNGKLDAATLVEDPSKDVMPVDGDLSICGVCGTFLRFKIDGEKVSFEVLTSEEFEALPKEVRDELRASNRMILQFRGRTLAGVTLRKEEKWWRRSSGCKKGGESPTS